MASQDQRFVLTGHGPDWPFGCTKNWGPYLDWVPGGGLHLCRERHKGHRGRHICKCGDVMPKETARA